MGRHQASTSGAERALAEVLNSGIPIDAIVTGDDMLALGALHELQRRGRVVPTDVALASTADDISQYFNPPVTSVALHPEQLGAVAVTVLMDLIECRQLEAVTWIKHELKIRLSTSATSEFATRKQNKVEEPMTKYMKYAVKTSAAIGLAAAIGLSAYGSAFADPVELSITCRCVSGGVSSSMADWLKNSVFPAFEAQEKVAGRDVVVQSLSSSVAAMKP